MIPPPTPVILSSHRHSGSRQARQAVGHKLWGLVLLAWALNPDCRNSGVGRRGVHLVKMTETKPPPALAKSDAVVIVGAGIFGLSTALHLAQRGYTNVTVFDKQPYHETLYSYFKGCDAASADLNKIVRSAYGTQTEYQELALEAARGWEAWNADLAAGGPDSVPPGMSSADRVFIRNANVSLSDGDSLPAFERATLEAAKAAGHAGTHLLTTDPHDVALAEAQGLAFAVDPFNHRAGRGKRSVGVIETTGGTAVADKACRYALHRASRAGVRFVLHPTAGRLVSLTTSGGGGGGGVETADGRAHAARLVVLACGAWTPSVLAPRLDGLCEATAGSVAMLRLPRASPLFDRFAPDSFPTWQYRLRDGADGGLYGFARDDDGWLKIGYRGTKYTNYQASTGEDGGERSVPVTRWSDQPPAAGPTVEAIPEQARKVIQRFLDDHLPELGEAGIGIEVTRLCWYTDSFDNHFVVDYVPGMTPADGETAVMVATGGSGHAFKFLPNIGNWVVDVIEGVGLDRPAIKAWRWRTPAPGAPVANKLMEGSHGPRAFGNVPMANGTEWAMGAV
ncbi:hypothetical protein RB597_003676 [Gaeumannomyces tritici]